MNKLISVIIPVKNGEKYLLDAIAGIKKQNLNTEIIVVDDNSDDNTASIAHSSGCIVVRHEKTKGPVAAKNSGLKIAKGDFIMFHDCDDIMNEGILKKLYDELILNPDIYAVMAKVKDFISPELSHDEKEKTIVKSEPYWGLFTGAVLIRKEVFDKIGLFEENITAGEIISWNMKMSEKKLEIKKIDLISTNRRIHTTNFGKTSQKKEFTDYASILRGRLRK